MTEATSPALLTPQQREAVEREMSAAGDELDARLYVLRKLRQGADPFQASMESATLLAESFDKDTMLVLLQVALDRLSGAEQGDPEELLREAAARSHARRATTVPMAPAYGEGGYV